MVAADARRLKFCLDFRMFQSLLASAATIAEQALNDPIHELLNRIRWDPEFAKRELRPAGLFLQPAASPW